MESLKVKSFNAVLKYGQWNHVLLPLSLQTDLIDLNNSIHSSMSGNGFCDISAMYSNRFNVQWRDGSWDFTLLGGIFRTESLFSINIEPHTLTFMHRAWSRAFALNGTPAFLEGFYITDFDLLCLEKKVMFYGYYSDCNNRQVQFMAQFHFIFSAQELHVKAVRSSNQSETIFFQISEELYMNSIMYGWWTIYKRPTCQSIQDEAQASSKQVPWCPYSISFRVIACVIWVELVSLCKSFCKSVAIYLC